MAEDVPITPTVNTQTQSPETRLARARRIVLGALRPPLARIRRTSRRSRIVAAVASAVLLMLAAGSMTASWRAAKRPQTARIACARSPAGVVRATVEDVCLLTGETRAVRSIEIRTPLTESWQIQIMWLAEDGAAVRQGDPIVEFDNTTLVQAIEEKKLQLTQAENSLASRGRTLAAEKEKKRVAAELSEIEARKAELDAEVPQDLRSRREWHQMQTALHEKEALREKAHKDRATFEVMSRAEMSNLRLARDRAARELSAAESSQAQLSIRAPRDGIFIIEQHWQYWMEDRKLQIGDTLRPGMAVASIPDLTEMEVTAMLPEVDEGRIAPAQEARCVLDTYPERVFDGRVEEVSKVARRERDRSGFPVRISLRRSDPALMRPGMSVRIEIVRRRWQDALAVPRGAVDWREGQPWVRLANGDVVRVDLDGCTATECVVLSGIAEGERVAL